MVNKPVQRAAHNGVMNGKPRDDFFWNAGEPLSSSNGHGSRKTGPAWSDDSDGMHANGASRPEHNGTSKAGSNGHGKNGASSDDDIFHLRHLHNFRRLSPYTWHRNEQLLAEYVQARESRDEPGRKRAVERLVAANIPLVGKMAMHYLKGGKGKEADYFELIDAGLTGLVEAIEKYEPDRLLGPASNAKRFYGYAKFIVMRHILNQIDFMSRPIKVDQRTRTAMNKFFDQLDDERRENPESLVMDAEKGRLDGISSRRLKTYLLAQKAMVVLGGGISLFKKEKSRYGNPEVIATAHIIAERMADVIKQNAESELMLAAVLMVTGTDKAFCDTAPIEYKLVAKRLGISRSYLSRLLKRAGHPESSIARHLKEELGIERDVIEVAQLVQGKARQVSVSENEKVEVEKAAMEEPKVA